MSEWYPIDDDSIGIDEKLEEIDFLVTSNDSGNIYATITFKQLNEINKKMKGKGLGNVKRR